jgi:hypothetical protein
MSDWLADLAFSHQHNALMADVAERYFSPDYFSSWENNQDVELDKRGIDAFIHLKNRRKYTVDVKADRYDNDNVVLEMMSNTTTGKVGWAQNPDLISDYIFYYKRAKGYVLILPAYRLHLHAADAYEAGARRITATTGNYATSSIIVPTSELEKAFGSVCKVMT